MTRIAWGAKTLNGVGFEGFLEQDNCSRKKRCYEDMLCEKQLPEAEEGLQGAEAETELVRHEERFRASEKRFRDLFEGSPDAIFVEDMDGTGTRRESGCLRLARFDPGRIAGQECAGVGAARVSSGGRARLQGPDGRQAQMV